MLVQTTLTAKQEHTAWTNGIDYTVYGAVPFLSNLFCFGPRCPLLFRGRVGGRCFVNSKEKPRGRHGYLGVPCDRPSLSILPRDPSRLKLAVLRDCGTPVPFHPEHERRHVQHNKETLAI